ncbi:hypothetical protein pb186bvf_004886 [Paramecium bursaria]
MRFCLVQGHQGNMVHSVCTFNQCQCDYRWVCDDCIKQNIHLHSHSHFITIERFIKNLKSFEPSEIIKVKSQLQKAEKLMKEMQLIFDSIQKILIYQDIYQQYVADNYNPSLLNNQQLNCLLSIPTDSRNYNNVKNHIQSVQIQLQNLNFQNIQFEMIPIQKSLQYSVGLPYISDNDKYLGFFKRSQLQKYNFKIISMPSSKCLYNRINRLGIESVSFSKDSKFAILMDRNDYFYYFSIKGLKLLFKKKLIMHNEGRNYIKWINNYQFITLNNQKMLIIYDILKKNSQLLNIPQFQQYQLIEYDSQNQLILTSNQRTIQFFALNGDLLIKHSTNKNIVGAIQICDNGKRLLTNFNNELRLWVIDHNLKKLQKIKEIHCDILQFRSVNFDKNIIIRLKDKLFITDDQLMLKYELEIQSYDSVLQSMNYILLETRNTYRVLKNLIKVN